MIFTHNGLEVMSIGHNQLDSIRIVDVKRALCECGLRRHVHKVAQYYSAITGNATMQVTMTPKEEMHVTSFCVRLMAQMMKSPDVIYHQGVSLCCRVHPAVAVLWVASVLEHRCNYDMWKHLLLDVSLVSHLQTMKRAMGDLLWVPSFPMKWRESRDMDDQQSFQQE